MKQTSHYWTAARVECVGTGILILALLALWVLGT